MWMGVCGMTVLHASPGQMSVIPDGTAVVGEVINQTFGAIDVSMLILLAFLVCSEHLSGCWPCPWHISPIHKLGGW